MVNFENACAPSIKEGFQYPAETFSKTFTFFVDKVLKK
jgi:hypothetical protein